VRAIALAAALLVLAGCMLVLPGCGAAKHADPYEQANATLLAGVPVYPGAADPKTSASGAGDTQFSARDWTLPAGANGTTVITWYERKLQAAGWKLIGKSFNTLRGTRGTASLSVGVRGRTLEAIANSRGV
jgi:hypothetical protein